MSYIPQSVWFSRRTVVEIEANISPSLSSIDRKTSEIYSRKPDNQTDRQTKRQTNKQNHRTTNPIDPPLPEGSKKGASPMF